MPINRFRDEYAFLSNFHPAEIYFSGLVFETVEHAFQAAKTVRLEQRFEISNAATPVAAKKLGRGVTLRLGWDYMRVDVMDLLVNLKFFTYPGLMKKLVATGDEEIIEGNTWGDTFWGVCNDVGENHLGKILISVRQAGWNISKLSGWKR